MSATEDDDRKTVSFKASGKKKKNGEKLVVETGPAPNAVTMGGSKTGETRTTEDLNKTPIRSQDATDEQFPVDLSRHDPRDAIQTAKLELQEAGRPGVTKFGQLIASDSDFEWLRSKREAEAEANFQVRLPRRRKIGFGQQTC